MVERRTQTETVAVLGAGIMGAPMARNLAASGLGVRVWNRTKEKAEALADAGVTVCDSPEEAVKGVDCFLTMLGDAHAVEATVVGERGALEHPDPGLLWIQCSTVGVVAADRFARLADQRGADFVDAPVLGTREPAERAELVVLASGREELQGRCKPVFEALARRVMWVGDAGAGSRLKLAVNNWVLAIVGTVSESIALCEAAGLDPDRFLEAIDGTPTDSPYAHLKGRAMIDRDFRPSFPAAGARKDAELIVAAMREHGVSGEVAEGLLRKFERTVAEGHGHDDMAVAVLHGREGDGGAR